MMGLEVGEHDVEQLGEETWLVPDVNVSVFEEEGDEAGEVPGRDPDIELGRVRHDRQGLRLRLAQPGGVIHCCHLDLDWDPHAGPVLHLSIEGPGDGSDEDILLAKVILGRSQLQLVVRPDVHRLGGVEELPFTPLGEVEPRLVFALLRHLGLEQDLETELSVSGLEEVN